MMKQILLLLSVLFTINSTAQNPQLSENIWYLQNVIISGVDNFPPSNIEVPSIPLEFIDINDFNSNVCNGLYGDLIFDDTLSNFIFTQLVQTLIICDLPENSDYESLYFSGFYFTNELSPFGYNIVQNPDDTKTLTVTGGNGDQAIYGSALLNVNQQRIAQIKTYPNPIENEISIDKGEIFGEIQISVYDLLGNLKFSKKINASNSVSIDTSQLTTGVYFFVFETEDGRIETQKIIKK